jgi:hypothetical protein
MNPKSQTPKTDKKVFFEINKSPYGVHYTTRYFDLEISGNTDDRIFYEETVSRIISANKEPPEEVYRMVELIVRHVATAVAELGADYVTVGLSTEVAAGAKLGIHVYLTYLDDDVWRGAIEVTFDGRDGRFTEGVHVVKKRVEFSDIDDAEALRREVIRVAKAAYNAYSKE